MAAKIKAPFVETSAVKNAKIGTSPPSLPPRAAADSSPSPPPDPQTSPSTSSSPRSTARKEASSPLLLPPQEEAGSRPGSEERSRGRPFTIATSAIHLGLPASLRRAHTDYLFLFLSPDHDQTKPTLDRASSRLPDQTYFISSLRRIFPLSPIFFLLLFPL